MMTAGVDYGVRVIRPCKNVRVGQVIFPVAWVRDSLVRHGFVERLGPDSVKPIPATHAAAKPRADLG